MRIIYRGFFSPPFLTAAVVCAAVLTLSACSPSAPLIPAESSPPGAAPIQTDRFFVDDFPGETDRDRINNALASMALKEGTNTLVFQAREYIIEPRMLDTYDPVIGGSNISDLVIEGNGATLVAAKAADCTKGYFFKLTDFSNVSIKDLTLVHAPLPFIQGTIASVDQNAGRTALTLQPGFSHVDQMKRTPLAKFWSRAGMQDTPIHPKPKNPSWMDAGASPPRGLHAYNKGPEAWEFETGHFNRDGALNGSFNWQVNDPVVIWKRAGQDGFCFESGKNLQLENVRVNSSLHYAFKLRGILGAALIRCRVEPAPGAMFSSSADGIDVQQSRNILIEHCRIIATGDDAISLLNHGHGDNGFTFEQRFPPPYPDTNEGVIIRNNHIEGGNRNAMLLLASNVEVYSNTIQNVRQYGIKFTGDNVRIENNRFTRLGTFAAYSHIHDELDTGIVGSDEWVQTGVVIKNNVFTDCANMPAILLKSVANARVEHNTVINTDPQFARQKPFNPYLSEPKAICVTSGNFNGGTTRSRDILVQFNRFSAPSAWASPQQALAVNGQHENIQFRDNTIISP